MENKDQEFIVSYIHENGTTILNQLTYAKNWSDAVDEIASVAHIILSVVKTSNLIGYEK